jgi:hypothetical protein
MLPIMRDRMCFDARLGICKREARMEQGSSMHRDETLRAAIDLVLSSLHSGQPTHPQKLTRGEDEQELDPP